MSECIFGVYFPDGHECDREFKCEGCETQNYVRGLVEIIMEEKKEKSNDTCETCKFRTGTRCDQLEEYIDTEDSCGFYKARKRVGKALKEYIQRHPEQYNSKYESLFTQDELINLSQSLRR